MTNDEYIGIVFIVLETWNWDGSWGDKSNIFDIFKMADLEKKVSYLIWDGEHYYYGIKELQLCNNYDDTYCLLCDLKAGEVIRTFDECLDIPWLCARPTLANIWSKSTKMPSKKNNPQNKTNNAA